MIAAGGTAGHVIPALAVADELRAEGATVSFLGTRGRAEAELVPAAGYEIDHVRARGIDRRDPVRAAGALWLAGRAMLTTTTILRRRQADALMSGGGYVGGVAGAAAACARLPLVLTEADSQLGLANRTLIRAARRVCLAFPIAGRDGSRYLVTGRPVPRQVIEADRDASRRRFGIAEAEGCLVVFGGSLGARSLNEAAFAAFAERADGVAGAGAAAARSGGPRIRVLHVSGRRDYPELRRRLAALGNPAGYTLLEWEQNFGELLAAADLVLARAGGSIFELAAAGKPAILVPYPFATADHQSSNARWMVEGGAAIEISDSILDPAALAAKVEALLADRSRLDRMSAASRVLARPDAAARVAAEVLAAARAGR